MIAEAVSLLLEAAEDSKSRGRAWCVILDAMPALNDSMWLGACWVLLDSFCLCQLP